MKGNLIDLAQPPGVAIGALIDHTQNGDAYSLRVKDCRQLDDKTIWYRLLIEKGPSDEIGSYVEYKFPIGNPIKKVVYLPEELLANPPEAEQGLSAQRIRYLIRDLQGVRSVVSKNVLAGGKAHVRDLITAARDRGWVPTIEGADEHTKAVIYEIIRRNRAVFSNRRGWIRIVDDAVSPSKSGEFAAQLRLKEIDIRKFARGAALIFESLGYSIRNGGDIVE